MIATPPDVSRSRILIVDDQAPNVALLEKIVRRGGFADVTSVTDSRAVVESVRSYRPDILLLDLQMPHLDGFEVMGLLPHVPEAAYMPILVMTADTAPESKRLALSSGATDFLVKPFDPVEVGLRIKNLLHMRWLQGQLRDQNQLLEAQVRERTADLWESIRRLERAENNLQRSQAETVWRLSIAAEFRDDETASQMHDIGKIGTPDNILLKPGRLTQEERAVMERHAEDGWSILAGSESELLQMAATIALTHHERIDGTGYPRRLRGDEIPSLGRIAAIADVFDALSTDRVYRRALPLPEVWQIMRAGRGSQFDGDLLDLFFDSMDAFLDVLEEHADPIRD